MTDLTRCKRSYEQLIRHHPEVDDYRMYYAQSLYKSGQYAAALKVCQTIDNPGFGDKVILLGRSIRKHAHALSISRSQVLKLQAAIKYESDDVPGCKYLIDQAPPDDPETVTNQACLLFKVRLSQTHIYLLGAFRTNLCSGRQIRRSLRKIHRSHQSDWIPSGAII